MIPSETQEVTHYGFDMTRFNITPQNCATKKRLKQKWTSFVENQNLSKERIQHIRFKPNKNKLDKRFLSYRFENCGAFLAFFNPYLRRSLTRESRVNNPFCFKPDLYEGSYKLKARAIPN